jgi:hypothetical protein
MNLITFQFSRPDTNSEKFLNRLITEGIDKLTRAEISHVDFVTPEGTLIGAHIEGGVQERPADYAKFGLRIRVTFPVTDDQADAALAYARSKIGTRYDAEGILGIAIGDSRLHNAHDLICSCLGSNIVDNEQYRIVWVANDHWLVTPNELRMVLTSQPGATEERIQG